MKKSYDSKFKSRVVLEALQGDWTVAEIASKYQILNVILLQSLSSVISFQVAPAFEAKGKIFLC